MSNKISYQRTIASKVVFLGKGLHTGRMVRLEVLPACANTGIVFQRTDSDIAKPVLAHAVNITSTELSTTIGTGPSSVGTIEHLMAAFAGMKIDNALVRLNSPEVPIMDGSAFPFVMKFRQVGYRKLSMPRKMIFLKEAVEVHHQDQFIRIAPSNSTRYSCSIDFDNEVIGYQSLQYDEAYDDFLTVSSARTFCHINSVNAMRRKGLALGGSLENAIVVTDTSIVNEGGLRGDNEFVRHKLLDMMGDLSLLGGKLVAKVEAYKPGHTLHAEVMMKLLIHKEKYLYTVSAEPKRVRLDPRESILVPSMAF